MPGTLVAAVVFAIVALLVLLVRARLRGDTALTAGWRIGLAWTAAAFGAVGLLFLCASVYNPVSTKNEGIETTFGATSGHLHNGFHLTWPWVKVHEMDAAIQTDSYTRDGGKSITVRIANQQTAFPDVSIRWRICTAAGRPLSPGAPGCASSSVDALYRDYRSFDHVRDSLVTRDLRAALNDELADYNPLDSIALGAPASGKGNPSNEEIARRVTARMRREIGAQIEVINVIIPVIHYDDATQARLNQLQQQVAQTRIAEQQRETNVEQAKANEKLSKSVDTSPNVLVSQCLTNVLEPMVKAHDQVPAGFSCWPPGSGVAGIIAGNGNGAGGGAKAGK